ncbi:hypothetical protein HXX76_005617 [Chlamydomonas incerta]|uniref:Indoleamine 2,3-dioxygenase n=1 Tax=Chlamydomonas incerta TaxID=51695 RepID=A0A835T804_CHLIN|nr:hypothetical protein HXX76_005617 [Chlamydomonas incerta]|eukprot:KAG2438003.1 hypothetical protein HXX76_005617 [Chlamydomonas incerta]
MLQRRAAAPAKRVAALQLHRRVHASAAVFGGRPHNGGFLPVTDPQERITLADPAVQEWEQALRELPASFTTGLGTQLRERLRRLPPFPIDRLLAACSPPGYIPPLPTPLTPLGGVGGAGGLATDERDPHLVHGLPRGDGTDTAGGTADCCLPDGDAWRAYLVLSFLAHAYVWCEPGPPPALLPAVLAVPWARLSAAVGMPSVLTYATYNLYNWKRLDPGLPPVLDNLSSINNFLGGPDEEWFRLVHVDIEARAGPAVAELPRLQQAAAQDDADAVLRGLGAISASLRAMQTTLARIGEHCAPDAYYTRVRPPISGWRNNPLLPYGLVYEGVYGDVPVQLYGATGAQSSVVPAFDRVLDIRHDQGRLRDYLGTMVGHMPPPHRAFLATLAAANTNTTATAAEAAAAAAAAAGSSRVGGDSGAGQGRQQPPAAANVRAYVLAAAASGSGHPRGGELRDAYDCSVEELDRFRSLHRAVAQQYIVQPASAAATAPSAAAHQQHYTHAASTSAAATAAAGTAPPTARSGGSSLTSAAGPPGDGAGASAGPDVTAAPPGAVMAVHVASGSAAAPDGLPAASAGPLSAEMVAAAGEVAEAAAAAAVAAAAGVTGTGGSDVIPSLTAFRDATRHHKIGAAAASATPAD